MRIWAAFLMGCSADYGVTAKVEPTYIQTYDRESVVVEGFEQASKVTELDIAVILDRSCSMDDELERAEEAIVDLHQQAGEFIPDFRLMLYNIGTNDMQPPIVLDRNSHELDIRMAIGTMPNDNDESAFSVIHNAFLNNYEPLMYRPTSFFVISDEDDSSEISPELFVEYVDYETYAPWEFSAIVPVVEDPANGCKGEGVDYIRAANLSGGSTFDLCGSGWDLFGGSKFSYHPTTRYELSEEPVDGTVEVYFNFELVWDWTRTGRRIEFDVEPPPGSNVVISYQVEI